MAKKTVDVNDGKQRCTWAAKDPLLAAYHDSEWGRPIKSDSGHLRRVVQEIFQCGLSWKLVLNKTPALDESFHGFDPARVAAMGKRDIERLMKNEKIIRNRRKIEATIHNAKVFVAMADEHGSYRKWFDRLPSATAEEQASLYPLFKKTFKFMGPETTKCYLMGTNKIPQAHEQGCWLSQ